MENEIIHYTKWNEIPETLKSKTQWREERLAILKDAKPKGRIYNFKHKKWVFLYDKSQCRPIKPLTDKQKDTLEKAKLTLQSKKLCQVCGDYETHQKWIEIIDNVPMCRNCNERYQAKMYEEHIRINHRIPIAKKFKAYLEDEQVLILDSETTGLDDIDHIIELAIIDTRGNVLHHAHYKPPVPITNEAYAIHGYSDEFLADKPSIAADYEKLKAILQNKKVLIYNADFDERLLKQSFAYYNLQPIDFSPRCMMYDMMYYEATRYTMSLSSASGMYTWHHALSDCKQVLQMLQNIVKSNLV